MHKPARFFRGLLLLSGLILTVHTLVPHVHVTYFFSPAGTSINSNPEEQTGWLDVLTDLVDAEMGQDHLEHFSPEKTPDFVLVVPSTTPTLPHAFFAERVLLSPGSALLRVEHHYDPKPEIQEIHLRHIALRGPPVMA